MSHTSFNATKYVFNLNSKEFVPVPTTIKIDTTVERPYGIGGMRMCFEVEEVAADGSTTVMLAKVFKKDTPDVVKKDYFNEAMAQCMCEEFAVNYNATPQTPKKVKFIVCHVVEVDMINLPPIVIARNGLLTYKTQDTREVVFVMEPLVRGAFTKYNSNFGEVYDNSMDRNATESVNARHVGMVPTAEAFSHFTLQESGGGMLVCDLQGVNEVFTDPQIHTEMGRGLGMGNMGADGISKWVVKHRCNEICKSIGLLPLIPDSELLRQAQPHMQQNRYQSLRDQMKESVKRLVPQLNFKAFAPAPAQPAVQPPELAAPASPLFQRYNESKDDYRKRCASMNDDERLELAILQSKISEELHKKYNNVMVYDAHGRPLS